MLIYFAVPLLGQLYSPTLEKNTNFKCLKTKYSLKYFSVSGDKAAGYLTRSLYKSPGFLQLGDCDMLMGKPLGNVPL